MGDASAYRDPMDQDIIELEAGWVNFIKKLALDPLEEILDDDFKDKTKKNLFQNAVYANVYTMCYKMCTQKSPYNWSEHLYIRHGQTLSAYLQNRVLPALSTEAGSRDSEQLLEEFVKRGNNHSVMNTWYRKFFMYLDRYHVKYHHLASLEDAGLTHFKIIVFDKVKTNLTKSIIELIDKEREGGIINRYLILSAVQMYERMGMGKLDVYRADLEPDLLEDTRSYYARKANDWIAQDSTPEYLLKVEKALEEEKSRVSNYLNTESEARLLQVLDKELLEKKETELLEKEGSGLKVLLLNNMLGDISRMFRLFSRIIGPPCGLSPIADIYRNHIIDLGSEKISQRLSRMNNTSSSSAGAAADKESNDDPQFIKDMLALHDVYITMTEKQFSGNAMFQCALKDAFVELVNRNVGKFTTAELISSFCDRIMKTGSTEKLSDSEIETFLEKTVQLFSYLNDKDMFAEIYRNQLAKRLLNQRSASDDMERLMIGKLKLKCGAQFTTKMEGMLNDLSIGSEQSQAFEKFYKENPNITGLGKLEFGVQVLTTGHWPQYKTVSLLLPPPLQRCITVFEEYYNSKNSHKRLQWAFSLGNTVVKGTFGPAKKNYDIHVTTLQAVALMAFSSSGGPLTFTALSEVLGITDHEVLKRILHSLSCGKFKVLKRLSAEGGGDKEKDKAIKNSDSFAFNDQFTSPMRVVRIAMASLDDTNSTKRVEDDRSQAIEAAVVRIMKARKTLSHQQLLAEVLTQLSFFSPNPKKVKQRIEHLIERDFLARDPDNPSTYNYLA